MTLPARAAALAAELSRSRIITPVLTDDAATFTVVLDEAAILAALEETRREAIDDLMPIVKAARSLLQESDHGTTEAEISAWRHLRALLDPPESKTRQPCD